MYFNPVLSYVLVKCIGMTKLTVFLIYFSLIVIMLLSAFVYRC